MEITAPTRNQIQLCVKKKRASISIQKKPTIPLHTPRMFSVPKAPMRIAKASTTKKSGRLKCPNPKVNASPSRIIAPEIRRVMDRLFGYICFSP